jgi:hypothetical protein
VRPLHTWSTLVHDLIEVQGIGRDRYTTNDPKYFL